MTVLRRTLHLAAVVLLAALTALRIIGPARADWIGNTEPHDAGSPVTWWRSARIIIRERWRD